MSHWQKGKLDIKCSTKVLIKALENIMPQWEGHILVDENEKLQAYDYTGRLMKGETFSILIPGAKNPKYKQTPGIIYNDLGIKRNKEGGWDVHVDNSGLSGIDHVEGRLTAEIGKMKQQAMAQIKNYEGFEIVTDDNNKLRMEFWVDEDDGADDNLQAF